MSSVIHKIENFFTKENPVGSETTTTMTVATAPAAPALSPAAPAATLPSTVPAATGAVRQVINEFFAEAETATLLHPVEHEMIVKVHAFLDGIMTHLAARVATKVAAPKS